MVQPPTRLGLYACFFEHLHIYPIYPRSYSGPTDNHFDAGESLRHFSGPGEQRCRSVFFFSVPSVLGLMIHTKWAQQNSYLEVGANNNSIYRGGKKQQLSVIHYLLLAIYKGFFVDSIYK